MTASSKFYNMTEDRKEPHIAMFMMVKNESKRIHVSLESVINTVDSIVIFDTGSTDNTIEIITDICSKHNIPLHIKQGEFIDFSTSRNEGLDFADSFPEIDYLLLMDCNDELRGGDVLRDYARSYFNMKNSGFLLRQEWWSGKTDSYYNVRFIKAHKKWRYQGKVHEWIKNGQYDSDADAIKDGDITIRVDHPDLKLFQDRTQDDDKSGKRFKRDKEILLAEYDRNPTDPRTVFYLAQTLSCLGEIEDSYYYYKIRSTLEGFWEERYHANQLCGELSVSMKLPWSVSLVWFMQAYEIHNRVEPLLCLAEHYRHKEQWMMSYSFASLACSLSYPHDCILFVNKMHYEYTRWHMLGIVAYYAGKFEEGRNAILEALKSDKHKELDVRNLEFYNEKLGVNIIEKGIGQGEQQMTRQKFIDAKVAELKLTNPKMSESDMIKMARKMWSSRSK